MQTIDIIGALSVIKWLFGVIAGLLAFIGVFGGYFIKKIHNTIVSDHEMGVSNNQKMKEIYPLVYIHEKIITKLTTAHELMHPDKGKISD